MYIWEGQNKGPNMFVFYPAKTMTRKYPSFSSTFEAMSTNCQRMGIDSNRTVDDYLSLYPFTPVTADTIITPLHIPSNHIASNHIESHISMIEGDQREQQ
jgi:hypothetical protein